MSARVAARLAETLKVYASPKCCSSPDLDGPRWRRPYSDHSARPGRLTVFLLFVLFLTGCHGQGGARSFTYKLHNPQHDGQYSTLHVMPDGALLMVSKRLSQPQQTWNLLRIRDWDTSEPREDKLDVDVGPNEENFGAVSGWNQGDGYDRNDQLLMDPGGNYLVVRLSPDAFGWNVDPDKYPKPRAVLNIIDLHAFKLLRRVELTDPLLAGGDMGFSPKGIFMVSGFREHSSKKNPGSVTDTRGYAVETLTVPGLEAKTVCTSTMVETNYPQVGSTPEESARIWKEYTKKNPAEMDWREDQRRAADAACRAGLAPLGFSSLDDVHQNLNLSGRLKKDLDYTERVPNQGPMGCNIQDLSASLKYEMLDCDEGRAVVFGRYRGFKVFHLEDGKQIMDLKVPRSTLFGERRVLFSGVLATSRGVTDLVLLRDGAKLEAYRLP